MTHVFSLAHLLGRPYAGPLADHGVAALAGRFRDAAHGGWYAAVGADGPTGRDKTAYEHAFVLLAASSATAAGGPRAPGPPHDPPPRFPRPLLGGEQGQGGGQGGGGFPPLGG